MDDGPQDEQLGNDARKRTRGGVGHAPRTQAPNQRRAVAGGRTRPLLHSLFPTASGTRLPRRLRSRQAPPLHPPVRVPRSQHGGSLCVLRRSRFLPALSCGRDPGLETGQLSGAGRDLAPWGHCHVLLLAIAAAFNPSMCTIKNSSQHHTVNTQNRDPIGSRWLIKEELEEMVVEKLSDQDYAQFIRLLERLLALPCREAEEEFVSRFRRSVTVPSRRQLMEPLQHTEQGTAFSTGAGKRKSARADVVVYGSGSGEIRVNGVDYLFYFPVMQDRVQLMFPFQFLGRLGDHDVTCTVSGGGRSAQAGAIRLALARALCSFATEDEVEWMRQAGLLTADPRVRERKKPGQEGARRKFTWKKR
ncbi:mitochondrial ribosomal protein S9 [Camelus ferus]|nr:mitochondrial ribosomal protein S9 [Camelus ferus]